jgi:TetR/AcrR family transcriptional regulator
MSTGADTQAKILEIAETQFARHGYAGAHLQQIAEEVGVQKTALYYYFPSKAALYTAILARMLEAFERRVSAALEREASHRERLVRLLDDLNDLLAERPNYAQILLRIFVDQARVDLSSLFPTIEAVIGRVLRFYRSGIEAGAFRKLSSRHAFQSMMGSIVFHYAAREFSAAVTGVDDIFTRQHVAWRREQARRILVEGLLAPER